MAEVLARARAAGVIGMVCLGTDTPSSRRAAEIASEPDVFAGAGLHPNSAEQWSGDVAGDLEDLLDDRRVVAVGETGLDFYRNAVDPGLQREVFAAHIELAKAYRKALVIHTRASVAEALDVLAGQGPPDRLVFHCWSGDAAGLRRAVDLGAYISFAGNLSFKNAGDLRALAAQVPAGRLLVETDSPYLSPEPNRGRPNEPRNLPHVGRALAKARSESEDVVGEVTAANARALFDVPG